MNPIQFSFFSHIVPNRFSPDFIQTKKYPSWTPVHRIIENGETAPFKQYFATWRDIGMQHTRLIRAIRDGDVDSGVNEDMDLDELRALKRSGGRALTFMPDNGTGSIELWRIQNNGPVAVAAIKFGIFYGASAYVMKYRYRTENNQEAFIVYYWQVGSLDLNTH